MLSRRALAAGLPAALGLAAGLPAIGRAAVPPTFGDALGGRDEDDTDLRAGRDGLRRLTIPVSIGRAGPYRFVVDTGADRSAVSADIADELGLEAGPSLMVHGIAGAELTPSLRAPQLKVGGLTLSSGDLPVLPRERLHADGMLGVDVLQGRRLVMDIKGRALRIRRSQAFETVSRDDEMVVRGMKRFGRLAVIDAAAESVPVTCFIDSGAELSVGNSALARLLRADSGRDDAPASLFGVTASPAVGFQWRLRRLKLGGVEFTDVPLVFADLHLFDLWKLNERPTVLLGMDVLQLFSRVELDYGQRQMLFRLAQPGQLPRLQLAQG